jgi:thymidylate synthase ThyX
MPIKAQIIEHSVSPRGKELITIELEYPRFIHGELMTHRVFSRNAAPPAPSRS